MEYVPPIPSMLRFSSLLLSHERNVHRTDGRWFVWSENEALASSVELTVELLRCCEHQHDSFVASAQDWLYVLQVIAGWNLLGMLVVDPEVVEISYSDSTTAAQLLEFLEKDALSNNSLLRPDTRQCLCDKVAASLLLLLTTHDDACIDPFKLLTSIGTIELTEHILELIVKHDGKRQEFMTNIVVDIIRSDDFLDLASFATLRLIFKTPQGTESWMHAQIMPFIDKERNNVLVAALAALARVSFQSVVELIDDEAVMLFLCLLSNDPILLHTSEIDSFVKTHDMQIEDWVDMKESFLCLARYVELDSIVVALRLAASASRRSKWHDDDFERLVKVIRISKEEWELLVIPAMDADSAFKRHHGNIARRHAGLALRPLLPSPPVRKRMMTCDDEASGSGMCDKRLKKGDDCCSLLRNRILPKLEYMVDSMLPTTSWSPCSGYILFPCDVMVACVAKLLDWEYASDSWKFDMIEVLKVEEGSGNNHIRSVGSGHNSDSVNHDVLFKELTAIVERAIEFWAGKRYGGP